MKAAKYKAIRREIGTQEDVAKMLGVARETVARRETGADRVTQEAALAIFALWGAYWTCKECGGHWTAPAVLTGCCVYRDNWEMPPEFWDEESGAAI